MVMSYIYILVMLNSGYTVEVEQEAGQVPKLDELMVGTASAF
jgi:hypothetical protein